LLGAVDDIVRAPGSFGPKSEGWSVQSGYAAGKPGFLRMTTFVGDIESGSSGMRPGRGPVAVFIPPELQLAACARLVAHHASEPQLAARRFVETAAELGIDLSLMWGTLDPSRTVVRQVCLAVLGAGRTAMLFLSGDARGKRAPAGLSEETLAERAAVADAACRAIGAPIPGKSAKGVRLAQALLEPHEGSLVAALRRAGFQQLGDLAYMRREPAGAPAASESSGLPASLRLVSVADLVMQGASGPKVDRMLIDTLEASYVDTKDCPELCGLREASDVLESHKAVGRFDPAIWWLLFEGDAPVGCALFSESPEHDSLELVYLGLAVSARGRGLGSAVLHEVLGRLGERLRMSGGVTCAVDMRNTAALRLYQRAGFKRFSVRIPMIRPLARS
jgi:ribosomal protein S18 acetylase RimI-like enzyme